MGKRARFCLTGTVLFAAVFRIHGLFANSFHADEALFASWARTIAVWRDPLLLTQPVDKPPLLFYLQALFYPVQGPVEWAARLPNFIASLLLVPLVGAVVYRLFRRWETALFAALLVALSPMHIQFSASAFTDPLLTTLLFGTVGMVLVGERPSRSGFIFGLAVLTKHQAWLFLPLLMALGWQLGWRRAGWMAWLRGFVPLLLVGWGWELARNGRFTLVASQIDNVGGLAFAPLATLTPRTAEWLTLTHTTLPVYLLLLIPTLFISLHLSPLHPLTPSPPYLETNAPLTLSLNHSITLTLFTLAYTTLHLILDIPVWDRYLLPLLPLLALLFAVLFDRLVALEWCNGRFPIAALGLIIALMLPQALAARRGALPVGARRFADSGAAVVAQVLADERYGTVLYDHWYSWQWRYHLFDKRVHLNWFADAAGLVEDLGIFYDEADARYVALPDDSRGTAVLQTLQEAGYQPERVPVQGKTSITLYRIKR